MALHAAGADIPEKRSVRSGEKGVGSVMTKRVYGNNSSVEIATRAPGYHTTPHAHEGEQINYVLEGEIWFFVEDQGFLCKKGDFSRIPANAIHWAWNRSDQESVVIETHAPTQIGGSAGAKAVGLYREGETPQVKEISSNRHVPYDWEATERKYNLR